MSAVEFPVSEDGTQVSVGMSHIKGAEGTEAGFNVGITHELSKYVNEYMQSLNYSANL